MCVCICTGCSVWTGVPLRTLLLKAGLKDKKDGARFVCMEGADKLVLAHICVFIYVCACVCVFVAHTYMCTCMHVYTCLHACAHACTYVHADIHVYT